MDISKLVEINREERNSRGGRKTTVVLLRYDNLYSIEITHRLIPEIDIDDIDVKFVAIKEGLIPNREFMQYNYEPRFSFMEHFPNVSMSKIDEFCENTKIARDLVEYLQNNIKSILERTK